MERPRLFIVLLCALCAFIWTLRAIEAVFCRTPTSSYFILGMKILSATLWIGIFIVKLKRYLFYKKEDQRL